MTAVPVSCSLTLSKRRLSSEEDRQDEHAQDQEPNHPRILAEGQDHPADNGDWGGQHHRAGHDDEDLNLLDVIGHPGDERRRPQLIDLSRRERQ
jgi:hypothetical protein